MFSNRTTLLAVVFVLFISVVDSGCTGGEAQDVIFMIDSSGSLSEENFINELEFAANLVENYLPNNARVACQCFGSKSYTRSALYFGLGDVVGVSQIAEALRERPRYNSGGTYLEEGLKNLQNKGAIPNDGNEKLMIVLTDGVFSDEPRRKKQYLDNHNVKVIVVGVGDDWDPNHADLVQDSGYYGNALVSDPANQIFKIGSFAQISSLLGQLGDFICTADHNLKLTEIMPDGPNPFLEYYNIGSELDVSTLGIKSNILQGGSMDFNFNKKIPTNAVIYVGPNKPSGCAEPSCFYLSVNTNAIPTNGNWYAEIYQKHQTAGGVTESTVERVEWTFTFPAIKAGYSIELRVTGEDNKLGSSWRRSCVRGGSPGVENEKKCSAICEGDDDCSVSLNDKNKCINPGTGCSCHNIGFLEDRTQCIQVPTVPKCEVKGVINTDEVYVYWDKALTSTLFGYKFTYAGQTQAVWSDQNNTKRFVGVAQKHWDKFLMQTITEAKITSTDIPGSNETSFLFEEKRLSEVTSCTYTIITPFPSKSPSTSPPSKTPSYGPSMSPSTSIPSMSPTPSPSHGPTQSPVTSVPSKSPVFDQPVAFLIGSDSQTVDNMYISAEIHLRNAPHSAAVKIWFKIQKFNADSTAANAADKWEDVVGEEQTFVEFPENSVASSVFTVTARAQNIHPRGQYKIVLVESPADNRDVFDRPAYELGPMSGQSLFIEVSPQGAKTIVDGSLEWWVWLVIVCACLLVLALSVWLAHKFYAQKKMAEEEERIAKQELEEEIRIGEEGLFHNAEATMNPLFNKTTNKNVGIQDPQFAMIDADVDEFKFENKTEFGAVLKNSEVPQAGQAIQVQEAGRPASHSAEMNNMWDNNNPGSYNARI